MSLLLPRFANLDNSTGNLQRHREKGRDLTGARSVLKMAFWFVCMCIYIYAPIAFDNKGFVGGGGDGGLAGGGGGGGVAASSAGSNGKVSGWTWGAS